MIATIRMFGLIRGLIFSLLIAASVYGYKNYLSWEWKPMSMEDNERFSERYIQRLDYESATNYPDMGVVVSECVSGWGFLEPDKIFRPSHSHGAAVVCRKFKSRDGSIFYGWNEIDDEP